MSRLGSSSVAESEPASVPWTPSTDAEREAVREQVGRILASTLFRNSRRFPTFLRHTVEHTLDGSTESLKERTVGVEAFGREPDYDTAQDPVVRMTATEVRKRLVQYYQAPEHEDEIRIGFQLGSYVPEFSRPVVASVSITADAAEVPATVTTDDPAPSARRRRSGFLGVFAAIAAIACAIVGWVTVAGLTRTTVSAAAIDQFWAPVTEAGAPALLCIGDQSRAAPLSVTEAGELTAGEFFQRSAVRYTDAVTLANLAGELRARKTTFRIRRPDATDFADLRDGPVVLVGGFNNAWTMRFNDGLRFTLESSEGQSLIVDRQHPENRQWARARDARLATINETYGLITRVFDPSTGHPIVMTAGLIFGTRAAGECLTDPACVEDARRLAPGDWRHKNIQIVVATKVIGEEPGAPRVVAAHLW